MCPHQHYWPTCVPTFDVDTQRSTALRLVCNTQIFICKHERTKHYSTGASKHTNFQLNTITNLQKTNTAQVC